MVGKGKYRKKTIVKVAIGFVITVFTLILFGAIFIVTQSERIINQNLSEFVLQQTDSIYTLNFEGIDIDFKKNSFTITEVKFKPQEKYLSDTTRKYYEFEGQSVVIYNFKFFRIIKEKSFIAESVKISKPTFSLSSGEKINFNTLSKDKIIKGDSLVIGAINEIVIDTILITDALLQVDSIFKTKHKVPKVNIEIDDFKIGGIKRTDSPFPFDVSDVAIKIENFHNELSDNIHEIDIEEISLSLLHENISANNVKLSPKKESLKYTDHRFTVEVPRIELKSHYVDKFYSSDTIPITALKLITPEIKINFGSSAGKGTPLDEINFYKLIENNLTWINIDTFSILNANLELYAYKAQKPDQIVSDFSINFYGFRVDSNSYKDSERVLSSLDLDISIEKYRLNHSDRVHYLSINKIKADTKSQDVSTGYIAFKPFKSKQDDKNISLIDIKSKGLSFKGVDFREMYHNRILPMKKMTVYSPEAKIKFSKSSKVKKDKEEANLFLQKMRDYLKGVYVDKTSIQKGKLTYSYDIVNDKTGFFDTEFNFDLENLSLDSATFYKSDKIFFADAFRVSFTKISLQLADDFHNLLADSVFLSSAGQSAEVYNLKVMPVYNIANSDSILREHNELLEIFFPEIQLSGADLHKAFFDKELVIRDFYISNPTFSLKQYGEKQDNNKSKLTYQTELYNLISDYLFKVRIQNLKMDNGSIHFYQQIKNQPAFEMSNLFSVRMINFQLDSLSSNNKDKLLFSDFIDLILKKQSFALADGVHKIDAQEIGILSTENRIYITNAKMYPDMSSPDFKNVPIAVYANIPSIQLSGTNIINLVNKGVLPASSVKFINPDIKLLIKQELLKEKSLNSISAIKGLNLFTADDVSVEKGKLELANYENSKSKKFANTEIDLNIKKLKIENKKDKLKAEYSDFSFVMNNTKYELPDKIHQLLIGKAAYAFKNKHLKINELSITPTLTAQQGNKNEIYKLNLPETSLADFNIDEFISEKKIKSTLLTLNNPTIEIISNNKTKSSEKFSPYKLNLYSQISKTIEDIEVNNIKISNAKIDIKGENPLSLKQVNVHLSGFNVDKNSDSKNKLLSSDFVALEINNVKEKTKDGFYNYSFDKLNISSKGTFTFKGLSLTPVYTHKEFSKKKKYQDDYVTIENAECYGSGFDIKTFFETDEIKVSKINVNIDNVDISRDNTYPLPPGFIFDLPQKDLREMKQKFETDSINITCKKLLYNELTPPATTELSVYFTDIKSTIKNLNNNKKIYSNRPNSNVYITGKLMGMASMSIDLNMDISSSENKFKVSAECDYIPFEKLNNVTEPALLISIKEGYNEKLGLYFEAQEDSSEGNIKFAYKDLKISVLSEKEGRLIEDKFISFLANTVAVRSDNPPPGKLLFPLKFYAKRDKTQSIVNYMWLNLYAGIKATFGLKDKPEQAVPVK